MNYASLLFLGVFLSFALSWAGMVLLPQLQIGRQDVATIEQGKTYPGGRSGLADQGKEIYRSLGCASCHTAQIRPIDTPRWGPRITVARDYLRDYPVLLSSQRLGPDLANVGGRIPDENWHLWHLYDPAMMVKGSTMPPARHLFTTRKAGPEKSPNALEWPKDFAGSKEHEIIPTREAFALVAYLKSLHLNTFLFEAPNPNPPKPEKPKGLDAESAALFEKGKALYPTTCGACHQVNGEGMPATFPTLVGTDWVLEPSAGKAIRIVLNGLQGPIEVNGFQFNNVMVPWKDAMGDEDIAALLTYVRNEWGNAAPAVKPAQVAEVRKLVGERVDPWTVEELNQIQPAP